MGGRIKPIAPAGFYAIESFDRGWTSTTAIGTAQSDVQALSLGKQQGGPNKVLVNLTGWDDSLRVLTLTRNFERVEGWWILVSAACRRDSPTGWLVRRLW